MNAPRELEPSDLHSAWSRLFFRCLASAGVSEVVCCPGSRSTPLALAADAEGALRTVSVVDERSAAFVALGQARTTGRPSVVIATSGTAGAHFFPAIIEAGEAGLPLIVVTADRPWELQNAGASQTIDQRKLFGDHVRLSLELGPPDTKALRHVPRIAAHAVAASTHPRRGPVHVNAQFRKPLEPITGCAPELWAQELGSLLERGAPRVSLPSLGAPQGALRDLARRMAGASRVLLALGPSLQGLADRPLDRTGKAVAAVARTFGAPVFAEATSDARYGEEVDPHAAASFDTLLAAGALRASPPELVVEVGAPLISPRYEALVSGAPRPYRVLLTDHAFPDPTATADELIVCDACEALEGLAATGAELPRRAGCTSGWASELLARGRRVDVGAAELASEWSEAAIARGLVSSLPAGAILMVGNSLPIRDLDAFGGGRAHPLVVQHQRGAAGIDGLVAGAVGTRSVAPKGAPVALVLGDVSTLHDVGAFALLANVDAPLAVVVVENGGGRIFEQLPIGQAAAVAGAFERLFLTRPPSFVRGVAEAFGVPYARVESVASFHIALERALETRAATVIECAVSPEDGRARRGRLLQAARSIVDGGPR